MVNKNVLRLLVLLTIPMLFVFGKFGAPEHFPILIKKVEEKLRPEKVEAPDLSSYSSTLACIEESRIKLKKELEASGTKNFDKAADLWTDFMVDSIFPYWYGTEWDFNGHTDSPRKGQIACGYFVSTTMRHSGIKLDRYKLAQKAASDIINEVCVKGSAKWFSLLDDLSNHIKGRPDGLYVLGLDYHVGFVLRENGKNYFIHSDYFNGKVTKEELKKSTAANSTDRYYIGSLSENKELMKRWLIGN